MNSKRILPPAFLTIAAAALLAGCGKSPTAPEAAALPPAPVIHTPSRFLLQEIVLRKFPAKTQSGEDWDYSLIASARRPDIYVYVHRTGQLPLYESDERTDATSGNVYHFTRGYGTQDLPTYVPYTNAYRIYVMDSDVGGDHDTIGWITLNLPAIYPNDNSYEVDHVFKDSGNRIEVEVKGQWDYE